MMGSPAVSIERLNSSECIAAMGDLMEYMGHKSFDAIMGLEIGGANGLEPLLIGSSQAFDRPVIDADWMGECPVLDPSYRARISLTSFRPSLSDVLANNPCRV